MKHLSSITKNVPIIYLFVIGGLMIETECSESEQKRILLNDPSYVQQQLLHLQSQIQDLQVKLNEQQDTIDTQQNTITTQASTIADLQTKFSSSTAGGMF